VAIVAVISLARQMLNRGPGWFSFSPALTRTIHEIMLRGFSWSGNQESVHRQSWPGAVITSTDTRVSALALFECSAGRHAKGSQK
jgi:hypothetical protein